MTAASASTGRGSQRKLNFLARFQSEIPEAGKYHLSEGT